MSRNKALADVTVIGAGIVGLNIASQLQREGYSTLLIDRDEPARGCSSGNAGIIATYGVTPVSLPGLWKQVPKMLMSPTGPLSLRWRHLGKIAPWLLRFWRASSPQTVQKSASALESLVRYSLRDYLALTKSISAQSLIKESPLLCVYPHQEQYEKDQYVWRLRQEHGVRWSLIEGDELHALEPALAKNLRFAVAVENSGFTLSPYSLAQAIFDDYIKNGGKFLQAEVQNVKKENGQVVLQLPQQVQPTNKLVIACGAWSGQLARKLGEPVPLEAERGYHITLANFEGKAPSHPIMSPAHKVIATPMEMGLRIAGMVEFGGFLPPDYRRSSVLLKQLSELFPQVKGGDCSPWMGHRPTLPDSLPVISQSSRHQDIFYAFGHQHVGLTAAPMTATLISDLVTQRSPTVDIEPFKINRF